MSDLIKVCKVAVQGRVALNSTGPFRNIGISAIMNEVVVDLYIKPLTEKIELSEGQDIIGQLVDKRKEWMDFIEYRSGKGHSNRWDKIAWIVADGQIKNSGVITDPEDLIQDTALRIVRYMSSDDPGKSFLRNVPVFNSDDETPHKKGPKDIQNIFSSMIKNHAMTELARTRRKAPRGISEYDVGEEKNIRIVEQLEDTGTSKGEEDIEELEEIRRELDRYVMKDISDKVSKVLYLSWMEATEHTDPRRVKFTKHIYPEFVKQMQKARQKKIPSAGATRKKWEIVRKSVLGFFKDSREYEISKKWKNVIVPKHLTGSEARMATIIERLTKEEYRRQVAKCILGE